MKKEMVVRRVLFTLVGALAVVALTAGLGFYWLKSTEPRLSDLPRLQNGDVLFQSERSGQALAILIATHSLYTHVGIVEVDPDGETYVIQATNVVKKTPLARWIKQSYGERVTFMRFRGMDAATATRVVQAAANYEGRPYDLFFRLAPDQIYCSELIYHAFMDGAGIGLGELQPISSLNIDNFAVRKLIKARWRLDPDCQVAKVGTFQSCYDIIQRQPIITPVSLARDTRFQTLYSNY